MTDPVKVKGTCLFVLTAGYGRDEAQVVAAVPLDVKDVAFPCEGNELAFEEEARSAVVGWLAALDRKGLTEDVKTAVLNSAIIRAATT
jgi:hypothetical protein